MSLFNQFTQQDGGTGAREAHHRIAAMRAGSALNSTVKGCCRDGPRESAFIAAIALHEDADGLAHLSLHEAIAEYRPEL